MTERAIDRRHTLRRESDRRQEARVDADAGLQQGAMARVLTDRVSWGSIWGGFLAAMGAFILLSLLASAIGLTTVNASNATAGDFGWAGVTSAVIGLVAFFAGGYVTGLMGSFVTPSAGLMNGFLVWALANIVILGLAAFGLGQLFGAAGSLYDQVVSGSSITLNINSDVVNSLQTSAWIAFIGMALAATASTLGGWLGTLSRDHSTAAWSSDNHDD